MKIMIQRFAMLMALVLATLLASCPQPAHAAESTGTVTSKTFTSTTADIPNPERGYYYSAAYVNPFFYINDFTASSIADVYSKNVRLTIGVLYLGAYRTTATLPQSFLDMFDAKMALLRAGGLKVILRPGYNYDSSGSDPTLSIGVGHLQQLAPLFKKNADVIAYVQAGMIGAWAEWHDSASMCPGSTASAACWLQTVNAELAAFHIATHIQVRYPKYVMNWFPASLQKLDRFSGSPQSRVGYHNDCFMSDNTDVGTYQSSVLTLSNPERARIASDTNWQPFGGETCSGFSPTRMDCSSILSEGPTYHLTYLNRNFYQAFFDSWTSGGCYDQVTRSIGYRFQLDSISHQGTVKQGDSITANVDMQNQGWSRIFSARRLNLQLRNTTTGATVICIGDQDLRDLPPQASSSTHLQVRCTVPSSTAVGTYDVYLAIPDIWAGTAASAPFAVRPANADNSAQGQSWDATNARFKVGTQVSVTAG